MTSMRKRQLRAKRAWRKADAGPNPAERGVLEAIERAGGLLVQFRAGKESASLPDGTSIGKFDVGMAIELGWLRPDPLSPALLHGIPHQRYFATGFVVIKGGRR